MKTDIAQVWRTYLIQRALASEYVQPYRVGLVLGGMGARNPILEELLPSMLFVRLMTVLEILVS